MQTLETVDDLIKVLSNPELGGAPAVSGYNS